MKKFLLLMIIPLMFSCNTHKKEMERLKAQNDSLSLVSGKQDESIIGYVRDMNQIQSNLDSIKRAERLITLNTQQGGELDIDAKTKIQNDIQLIYSLMLKNKNAVAVLNKKLKKSNLRIAELEKMLKALTLQIEEKDSQINLLKDKLANMNIQVNNLTAKVDTLSTETKIKTKIIEDKTTALNTAWYTVGTSKELTEQKVLTKEGGFIGIGKNKKLSQDFNRNYFTKIDITKIKEIPIYKKKATIVTTHPSNSYRLDKDAKKVNKLIITDSEAFWSVSKYLVIIVE